MDTAESTLHHSISRSHWLIRPFTPHHRHVWLVPTYTKDISSATTSFHVVVQNTSEKKMDDLARGAGGGYRYIFSKTDQDEPSKIVYAALLRTQSAMSSPPPGWDLITADINKGRRKSRLYIVFKTTVESTRSAVPLWWYTDGNHLTGLLS